MSSNKQTTPPAAAQSQPGTPPSGDQAPPSEEWVIKIIKLMTRIIECSPDKSLAEIQHDFDMVQAEFKRLVEEGPGVITAAQMPAVRAGLIEATQQRDLLSPLMDKLETALASLETQCGNAMECMHPDASQGCLWNVAMGLGCPHLLEYLLYRPPDQYQSASSRIGAAGDPDGPMQRILNEAKKGDRHHLSNDLVPTQAEQIGLRMAALRQTGLSPSAASNLQTVMATTICHLAGPHPKCVVPLNLSPADAKDLTHSDEGTRHTLRAKLEIAMSPLEALVERGLLRHETLMSAGRVGEALCGLDAVEASTKEILDLLGSTGVLMDLVAFWQHYSLLMVSATNELLDHSLVLPDQIMALVDFLVPLAVTFDVRNQCPSAAVEMMLQLATGLNQEDSAEAALHPAIAQLTEWGRESAQCAVNNVTNASERLLAEDPSGKRDMMTVLGDHDGPGPVGDAILNARMMMTAHAASFVGSAEEEKEEDNKEGDDAQQVFMSGVMLVPECLPGDTKEQIEALNALFTLIAGQEPELLDVLVQYLKDLAKANKQAAKEAAKEAAKKPSKRAKTITPLEAVQAAQKDVDELTMKCTKSIGSEIHEEFKEALAAAEATLAKAETTLATLPKKKGTSVDAPKTIAPELLELVNALLAVGIEDDEALTAMFDRLQDLVSETAKFKKFLAKKKGTSFQLSVHNGNDAAAAADPAMMMAVDGEDDGEDDYDALQRAATKPNVFAGASANPAPAAAAAVNPPAASQQSVAPTMRMVVDDDRDALQRAPAAANPALAGFESGERVRIDGLLEKPDLNGTYGIVIGPTQTGDRLVVQIGAGAARVRVKPERLTAAPLLKRKAEEAEEAEEENEDLYD